MHKELIPFKMTEILVSALKTKGPSLKSSIMLNHKIAKLQSGIFQVIFKLMKQIIPF